MKKKLKEKMFDAASCSRREWKLLLTKGFLFLWITFSGLTVFAQDTQTVRGKVTDETGEPLPGVSVVLKNNTTNGTVTDAEGNFVLTVPAGKQTLRISFLGMATQEAAVTGSAPLNIVLKEDTQLLEEVVVVGYGQQKKASVVGSITQTNAQVLERSAGVTSLGQALTGNLPGVITMTSTGLPGEEDPQIVIRGQTSWNNSDPLVLVDGIERPIGSIDISSVETISVLKDASATAIYGVKGGNGVILINTKRGQAGKAVVDIRANSTMRVASKLPEKLDAYDTFILKNQVVERELMLNPTGWGAYQPMNIINKYRYPANDYEWDRYPNVDWEKELLNDNAMSYNLNANVSGGTDFVKYYTGIDYQNDGDLFKSFDSGRGYRAGFTFNRINVRSNLDFNLSKTTQFSTNLSGSQAVRTRPWTAYDFNGGNPYWASIYRTAPDAMRPVYSDGTYGFYSPRTADVPNSVSDLSVSGIQQRTTSRINADFILKQNLDIVTKGLNVKATLSTDNQSEEQRRGINDLNNYPRRKWINPETGDETWERGEDYVAETRWQYQKGDVEKSSVYRRLYYAAQIDYARQFGLHNVTAMGVFNREEWARGSRFYHYREDWAYRTTYNYAMKYLLEINGCYNGSEQFGPGYRFAYFPSFSAGWTVSEESFVKGLTFIDILKVRASYGKIGDDKVGNVDNDRWLYADQWAYSGNARMGDIPANSPYTFYKSTKLGNPFISWETVEKKNLGFDYGFLKGLVAGSVDIFRDVRNDVLIDGSDRAIPSYFGVEAPAANLGKVKSNGYELELRLNYPLNKDTRLWMNANMTHSTNKVLFADDPQLTPSYLKNAGYKISQTKSYIDAGFIQSWDDLYGTTQRESNSATVLPGDYIILDFNGDGMITTEDQAPYKYSNVPENTYSISTGFSWKWWSLFVQFYGVSNVSRLVQFPTFHSASNVAYVEDTYWTVSGGGAIPYPRVATLAGTGANGTQYIYDGSYMRLRNAEIAYTLSSKLASKLKMKSCKIYLNGDNLLLWTKMPDDRESNFSGGSSSGAYPTVKRFNMGINITF